MVIVLTVILGIAYPLAMTGIAQVVFVDLTDREQGVEAVLAPVIFVAQKLVLLDRHPEDFIVIETPTHLDLQFGDGDHAGIRFQIGRAHV